jgi:membrane protein DedA with SNARE-associated domain
MDGFLDWVSSLPLWALYAVLGAAAAIENVVPPVPADTVVAFGSFLAARGQGTLAGAFLSTWAGNIAGAALMYGLGRRYGAEQIEKRLLGAKGPAAQARLSMLYGRYGIAALFVSRFLPAVRAIVPPFAGALRIPAMIALPVMAIASGLWYGAIALMAFRVGTSWEDVSARIAESGKWIGIAAVVVAATGAVVWWLHRRHRAGTDG